MTKKEKRWQRCSDPELERLYVRFEKIVDILLLRGATKVIQAMEKERLLAEGDVEKMDELCIKYLKIMREET